MWYSCEIADWIDAESQRIDRKMEVGIEGQVKKKESRMIDWAALVLSLLHVVTVQLL